jgi:hypothetical protein
MPIPSATAARVIVTVVFLALAGCASTPPRDRTLSESLDCSCVSLATYNIHTTSMELEALHRIQINDTASMRGTLESILTSDVVILWSSIQNPHTTTKERDLAYGVLRLIAIQNEKFPVPAMNDDPQVIEILGFAIQNNPAKADQLRRQDWSKPKWVKWVD